MLYDLRVGLAGSSPEAFSTTLPSETKARHRRFFRNRERRAVTENEKRQTAAPPAPAPAPAAPAPAAPEEEVEEVEEVEEGEVEGEESLSSPTDGIDSGIDSPSSADESTAQVAGAATTAGSSQSAPPAIAATTPPPALEGTSSPSPAADPSTPGPSPSSDPSPASSPSPNPTALPAVDSSLPSTSPVSKSNSNPPINTVPLPTRSRASVANTTPTTFSTTSATFSTTNVVPPKSEITTRPALNLQTSKSRSETASITSQPVIASPSSTVVLALGEQQGTQAANLATASGAGSTMISGIRAPIDGKMVIGVVSGVLGTAIIILFIVWRFMKVRRARSEAGDLEKPTAVQKMFGQTYKLRDDPHDDTNSVSKFWGGATTVGATTEAAFNQAYVPPSMQRGGAHDETAYNATRFSQLESQLPKQTTYDNVVPPIPAAKPAVDERAAPAVDDNGLIQPPNRWFGRNSSVSMASVPRFRSIKSWALDQRTRTENRSGTEQWDQPETSKWSVSGDSKDSFSPPYDEK